MDSIFQVFSMTPFFRQTNSTNYLLSENIYILIVSFVWLFFKG